MNAQGEDDMLLLADHVESGDRKGRTFGMGQWQCGTTCCMGGEAAHLFPDKLSLVVRGHGTQLYSKNGQIGMEAVADVFGISNSIAQVLFGQRPEIRLRECYWANVPKSIVSKTNRRRDCARSLRRFVKWNRKQKEGS